MTSTAARRYDFSRIDDGTSMMAERLGVERGQVIRWRKNGLTEQAADRVATALGLVDIEVWPELLDEAIADIERECAAPDCSVRFVPVHRGAHRRFCCSTCRFRTATRRRRENPAERERIRAYQRAYNAHARAERARRAA